MLGLSVLSANLLSSSRIVEPPSAAAIIESDHFQQTVAAVDQEFREHLRVLETESAPPADYATIARRLSLALTGTIPSFEELRALKEMPEQQRTQWWVSRLLNDRRSADYLAERFARSYVGTQNGPFIVYRRRRFVTWLGNQLQENRRYDELVRELISDTGLWTDSPAVNFLTVTLDENGDGRPDPIRLAARTSRAFLGMRIDCLQCHDDKLGNVWLGDEDAQRDGEQADFHRLAAFYSEAQSSLLGLKDDDSDYKYQYLNAEEEEVVPPQVPFNGGLLETLPLDEETATRRELLARWVTHPNNKPFARATVNRVWALMFGRPLVEPVDDIPLHGDYPPGLETLADAFVKADYDLKWLIRVIASTEVFQRDSRADFEVTDKHELRWAVFPLTRLRPEQVAGSMIQAASLKTIDSQSHIVVQLTRFGQQNDFIQRYGDMGEDEFDDRGGTVTQRLLLMNGQLTRERTTDNPFMNAASRIATLAPTDEKAVETAYLAVLSRRPSSDELGHFVGHIQDKKGAERQRCLEDLYWVLLNSTEFSWNH
ncbi:MAG: DUF1553 domain-containing protein [Planctomycetales bacterium]|nr:DUF1553 domain-containing protein [Planctomycetales bacterium]